MSQKSRFMAKDGGATWTIVVAAGSGSRFGGAVPKQFVTIGGQRVVDWSIDAAAAVSDGVVVVLPVDSNQTMADRDDCELVCVAGGASRSESVRHGLAAVPDDVGVVLVHDAARPLASPALFERAAAAIIAGADAVVPVIAVIDTMRDLEGLPVDRARLQVVQTPQAFAVPVLRRAHESENDATDDASLVHAVGGTVATVEGERWNLKVTEAEDELVVAALLEART